MFGGQALKPNCTRFSPGSQFVFNQLFSDSNYAQFGLSDLLRNNKMFFSAVLTGWLCCNYCTTTNSWIDYMFPPFSFVPIIIDYIYIFENISFHPDSKDSGIPIRQGLNINMGSSSILNLVLKTLHRQKLIFMTCRNIRNLQIFEFEKWFCHNDRINLVLSLNLIIQCENPSYTK